MTNIKIKNFTLKNYGKPFIVAEAGINHNGKLLTALKMVDVAKKAGCDAIKFQTYKADELVKDKNLKFLYKSKGKIVNESMHSMFRRNELSIENWKSISNYCKKKKIIFFSTPQNYSDLKILLNLKIPAIKVGSDDFVNLELIKKYLKHNLPVILSTGMATLNDINNVLKIKNINKRKVIFLLCTSQYPTSYKDVNILKVLSLKKKLGKKYLLGFSDHTIDNTASIMAVAHGCCFLKKHFTLNNNSPGPDHWFSLNPSQLKNWVNCIKQSYLCLGSHKLQPTKKN
jgi:N,N'-diacetyllegionaminate synthase